MFLVFLLHRSKKSMGIEQSTTQHDSSKFQSLPPHLVHMIYSCVDKRQRKLFSTICTFWRNSIHFHCSSIVSSSVFSKIPIVSKYNRITHINSMHFQLRDPLLLQELIKAAPFLEGLRLGFECDSIFEPSLVTHTCTSLKELHLTKSTGSALEYLNLFFPNLKRLTLQNPYMTVLKADLVVSFKQLKEFCLITSVFANIPLEHSLHQKLSSFSMVQRYTDVYCKYFFGHESSAGFNSKYFQQWTSLKALRICHVSFADDGLVMLGDHLRQLERLEIYEVDMTDESLMHISMNCKYLMELTIWNCPGLTDKGYTSLSKLLYLTSLVVGPDGLQKEVQDVIIDTCIHLCSIKSQLKLGHTI
eukprot:TRINITY_DN3943_c0_g3_i1.p1 TRINITY_DN3943_c0_g3~~TRINITY_DN3943_c0_g3_i1.p1  ORF type:complete len:359 (-),score=35.92 TRINITY_DN3943_c0_g3_i1:144-1220(-)